jgi:BlaI family transcriptional regulator, penicillinase repressor
LSYENIRNKMDKVQKTFKPTESELDILSVLWENGPSTVRYVNDLISLKKPAGYTTTLKLMQIMYEKGMVDRVQDGRTHVYSAVARQEEMQVRLMDRLLETAFSGSASKLVMQALGNHRTSEEELQEIKDLIKKIEEGQS